MVIVTSRLFTFGFWSPVGATNSKPNFCLTPSMNSYTKLIGFSGTKTQDKKEVKEEETKYQADKSDSVASYPQCLKLCRSVIFLVHLIRSRLVHNSILDIHRLPWRKWAVKWTDFAYNGAQLTRTSQSIVVVISEMYESISLPTDRSFFFSLICCCFF